MVEIMNALIKALKKESVLSTKGLADKFYSVDELYEHRLVLFKILWHTYQLLSWKSKEHDDETMFNGDFIAGITTPKGNASYHFKTQYYDDFVGNELKRAPFYDGYDFLEALNRFNSLLQPGNSYIETGKSIIHSPSNEISLILSKMETRDQTFEKRKRLMEIMNELIILLEDLELIQPIHISDGNHKIGDLYREKRELFKLICHIYKDLAWKSKVDSNGISIFENTFMAGLNTPKGPVCYIFNGNHWNQFDICNLSRAPLSVEETNIDVIKKISSITIRQARM